MEIGQIVETRYNSGTYLGKVVQLKGNFILVETMAVMQHPTQGDLHNRGQVEGVAFHERKAMAEKEKFNARKRDTIPYGGEVPSYAASLQDAVTAIKAALRAEDTAFNKLSLERIADLEEHYYNKIYQD